VVGLGAVVLVVTAREVPVRAVITYRPVIVTLVITVEVSALNEERSVDRCTACCSGQCLLTLVDSDETPLVGIVAQYNEVVVAGTQILRTVADGVVAVRELRNSPAEGLAVVPFAVQEVLGTAVGHL
jgi:hypothetical protein